MADVASVPKMYQVKPFFDTNAEIVSNVSMYKVKKFEYDTTDMPGSGGGGDAVSALERRQEKVLVDLQRLQKSVADLAQQRGVTFGAASSSATSAGGQVAGSALPSPVQAGSLHDLVISADPACVPLSLLVLVGQLHTAHPTLTQTFVHSSATDTSPQLRGFLSDNKAPARSQHTLAISLVWKKVGRGPPLMVSPTSQTYIEGEANIARYLSRLLPPAQRYDAADAVTATQVDEVLDLCQQQIAAGNAKERQAALRSLNAKLGRAAWVVGAGPGLGDVVAWSTLNQAGLAGADAPANVAKWLKACNAHPTFSQAVAFLQSS